MGNSKHTKAKPTYSIFKTHLISVGKWKNKIHRCGITDLKNVKQFIFQRFKWSLFFKFPFPSHIFFKQYLHHVTPVKTFLWTSRARFSAGEWCLQLFHSERKSALSICTAIKEESLVASICTSCKYFKAPPPLSPVSLNYPASNIKCICFLENLTQDLT